MKLLQEFSTLRATRENGKQKATRIYCEEYATIWIMTAKIIGDALPSAQGWRYKKSEYKTKESAINAFIRELNERDAKYMAFFEQERQRRNEAHKNA